MTAEKPVLFSRGIYSLQQIVDKPEGLPCVVNTRSRLLSFQKVPIEPEGLHLCLEREVEIEFARIKVLPFYDENEAESKHGAEFVVLYSEFENEEFYLPLRFNGKLKIDSYHDKRQRFATVAEVFDQRPRYVRTVTDTMSVSPRRNGGMKMKCVSSGSILEVKGIATLKDRQKRYLRCVMSNKNFLFGESVRINFTAVADDKEYTLKQIKEAGFWLPKPIQFKQGTVLEEHIVQFHSDIASDMSIMLTGILDLLETARIRMLVGRAYDKQNKCFKTLLLPASLYDHLYVKRAEFETPTQRSRYIDKHFGKPSGQDDVFEDKLFLLSATEDLVYWLKCSYTVDDDINDTPDEDSDYEQPPKILEIDRQTTSFPDIPDEDSDYEQPPKILEIDRQTTSFPDLAQNKAGDGKNTAVFVQMVQLLPISGIQDQNVLHKIIQKAKLGFGQVHEELRSLYRWNEIGEENMLEPKQEGKGSQEVLNKLSEEPSDDIPIYDDAEILMDDCHVTNTSSRTSSSQVRHTKLSPSKKPLPALPVVVDTKALDEIPKEHGYVTKSSSSGILPPGKRPLPAVPIGNKPPLIKRETRVCYEEPVSPGLDNVYTPLEGDAQTLIDEDGDYVAMDGEIMDIASTEVTKSSTKHTAVSKEEKTFKTHGFESYSVEETVKCFKKCGLDRLASVCKENTLDGYFMVNIDQDTLKSEPFCMNPLQINKLRMIIYHGWQPNHSLA